jgi:hypothetical protein
MFGQIAIGIALMVATTFVHAGITGLTLWILRNIHADRWATRSGVLEASLISGWVVALFLASLVEAAIWAVTYMHLGALQTFEEALYFSIVTYTTLGFGDITLSEEWRLLCSFEAANGIILFGWSTALVYALVQRMIQVRESSQHRPES